MSDPERKDDRDLSEAALRGAWAGWMEFRSRRLGELAAARGWVTAEQVEEFGEAGIRHGLAHADPEGDESSVERFG